MERMKNNHMLIPWGVMTSHKKCVIGKNYWRLVNVILVIDAILEKELMKERSHI